MEEAWDLEPGEPCSRSHRVGPRANVEFDPSCLAGYAFDWFDPPPGGWYGRGFCPEQAGDLLTPTEVRMAQDYTYGPQGGNNLLMWTYPYFGMPM